jgi:hypothetical protein
MQILSISPSIRILFIALHRCSSLVIVGQIDSKLSNYTKYYQNMSIQLLGGEIWRLFGKITTKRNKEKIM